MKNALIQNTFELMDHTSWRKNADILFSIFLPLFLSESSFNLCFLPEFFCHNLSKKCLLNILILQWICYDQWVFITAFGNWKPSHRGVGIFICLGFQCFLVFSSYFFFTYIFYFLGFFLLSCNLLLFLCPQNFSSLK